MILENKKKIQILFSYETVQGLKKQNSYSCIKRLPAMQETQVRLLGQEDPLEKEMATHCSTLAWKIPWMEEPG